MPLLDKIAASRQIQKGSDSTESVGSDTEKPGQVALSSPPQKFRARSPQITTELDRPFRAVVQRDDRGRLLPGQSLNPGGRPRGLATQARELLDQGKANQFLLDVLEGHRGDDDLCFAVVKLLQDRAYGKAVSVSITGELDADQVNDVVEEFRTEAEQTATHEYLKRVAEIRLLAAVEPASLPEQGEGSQEGESEEQKQKDPGETPGSSEPAGA